MSSPATRQHASNGPSLPQVSEPSHAERVRTLLALSSSGTLSTLSRKHAGFPFGSLMPYAVDLSGCPILLISNMAVHTQNLKANAHASLFITQAADGDPLGAARATIIGLAQPVPASDTSSAREQYLARHENSRYWVDFADFSFFRLHPVDLYYVGGFGVMGWVEADDYRSALPDPLAQAAPGILAHMNADHLDAMLLLARARLQLEAFEVAMTSIDRLGFSLRLKTADGTKVGRINFAQPLTRPEETRAVLVAMVTEARSRP